MEIHIKNISVKLVELKSRSNSQFSGNYIDKGTEKQSSKLRSPAPTLETGFWKTIFLQVVVEGSGFWMIQGIAFVVYCSIITL